MDKPLRLLMIEDSEDDALLLLRVLRQGGYEPICQRVEDAASMTTALQSGVWDIVISDYALPRFDGMAALELLQCSGLDIPFIIVSGVIGEETAVAAMRAGAHDYLIKSNLNRLVPAIERELREAADRRAHKVAEDEIRKLSSALSQSASLIMVANAEGIIEYVNAAFVCITAYNADEVIGKAWSLLQADLSFPDRLTEFAEVVRTHAEWHGELQVIKKSGDPFWVLATLSPVRNNEGRIVNWLCVAEDITEHKQLEAELQRYNEQLEQMVEERTAELRLAKEETDTILNATSDAIALALPNGDIKKTNPAFNRIFGSQNEQTLEQILWALADEDYVALLGKALHSVIYDQHNERIQASFRAIDGQELDADLIFVPVEPMQDQKSGLVFSLRDISHLKENARFKTNFVANVTHDLSNPIEVLKWRLHLLRRTPDNLAEHIQVLERQIERLEDLVIELRVLSELDQRKVILDLKPLDLNSLIAEVVENHKPVAQAKQQELIFEPDTTLPLVSADPRKIERVVANLVANALNYTPNGGLIKLTSLASSSFVTFSVQDTGIGIADEDMPHIFERFYRSDHAKKTNKSGTGLGLAITKEMVDLHHGTILVNTQPNVGTTITVQLPLA